MEKRRSIGYVRSTRSMMAERISEQLCADLLALRTRRLVDDIRRRYRCQRSTAFHAVTLARVRVGVEKRHGW